MEFNGFLRTLDKKYSIIYADPPWKYNDKRKRKGGAEDHYKTLNLKEICALPVKNISDTNCILFLWVTFPNLKEGLQVIDAWGFKYKTLGFSWFKLYKNGKPCFGIGHYSKSNCEVCLLAVKGKVEIISNKVSSVVISPREGHSKKPDEVRDRIVELCGDVPRIELFARQQEFGWDVWGDEVDAI